MSIISHHDKLTEALTVTQEDLNQRLKRTPGPQGNTQRIEVTWHGRSLELRIASVGIIVINPKNESIQWFAGVNSVNLARLLNRSIVKLGHASPMLVKGNHPI